MLNGHLKNEEYDTKAGKVKKLEVVVDYWEFCDPSSGKKNDESATPNPFTNPPPTDEEVEALAEAVETTTMICRFEGVSVCGLTQWNQEC